MKAEVINAYTDRNTGEVHLIGDEVELTPARFSELAGKKVVKRIVEDCDAAPEDEQIAEDVCAEEMDEPDPAEDECEDDGADEALDEDIEGDRPIDFGEMSVAELKQYITESGSHYPASAKKAALVKIAQDIA